MEERRRILHLIDWSLLFLLPVLISGSSNPDLPMFCGTSQWRAVENWPSVSDERPKIWDSGICSSSRRVHWELPWSRLSHWFDPEWGWVQAESAIEWNLADVDEKASILPSKRANETGQVFIAFSKIYEFLKQFSIWETQAIDQPISISLFEFPINIQNVILCPANGCHSSWQDWPYWIYGNHQHTNLLIQINEWVDE
jgi:hypothetical protein